MFNKFRKTQFDLYNKARKYFIDNYKELINLEKYLADYFYNILSKNLDEIVFDYNESSHLFPFWQKYPPDDRGRQPKGDQFPWLEVAEHVFGAKISRFLGKDFFVKDTGLPTGPDQRFVVKSGTISKFTNNFTDSCWLFVDIKSVGPRDDQDHTVMSHNQISGDGIWKNENEGISNSVMTAVGQRTSHSFYCTIPPIYILSDSTIAPVIHIVVKPIYGMLSLEKNQGGGQPLRRITVIVIPNGVLLEKKPNYLASFPSLFFPGKDDKTKNPLKVRCRVSFSILRSIADWRVREIYIN